MAGEVYITRISKFLPNRPVDNDSMERYLGRICNKPSAARRIVLGKNKIACRYYALDEQGHSTHSNAGMTAEAVRRLTGGDVSLGNISLLCCGTTSPDQMLPSHAAMVHGELGSHNMELASFAGACCSGIQALKYAYLSVLSGNSEHAVCTGSERISPWLRANRYEKEAECLDRLKTNGYVAFEKEFLRWMLSDGAGAVLLQPRPAAGRNLKIEWVEIGSFAHIAETCMYAGASKQEDGNMKSWHDCAPETWLERSIFSLHQDVKLLGRHIVNFGRDFLKEIIARRKLDIQKIRWFLPHLSSDFFRGEIMESLNKAGMGIPEKKWFTNLATVGNVGAASPFLMLEELFHSGQLAEGDQLLMMIPESARFSYAYCLFTVC